MTLPEVLQELIERLGAAGDTLLAWEQVRAWPPGAIAIFQEAGWIEPREAASKVECPGCEESCFMSVHVRAARNQQPASAYVACDSRAEMGNIKVAMSRLRQWQITDVQVALWLAGAFGLKGKPVRDLTCSVFTIGTLQGKNRLRILQFDTANPVSLRVAGHSVPLLEVVSFEQDHLCIDRAAVLGMADFVPVAESAASSPRRAAKPSAKPIPATDSELGSPEWRKQNARNAANALHDLPGGSRDKQRQMREIWASGKYSSRNICAEQECAGLDMSYDAARKALTNIPAPSRC
jgi:hypothetical protein